MRISGITIPDQKHLGYALTVVYGIGRPRALSLLKTLNIHELKKVGDLSTEEENAIRESVESFTIEGELRRTISGNIKRLKDIQSYRGSRHAKRLIDNSFRTSWWCWSIGAFRYKCRSEWINQHI